MSEAKALTAEELADWRKYAAAAEGVGDVMDEAEICYEDVQAFLATIDDRDAAIRVLAQEVAARRSRRKPDSRTGQAFVWKCRDTTDANPTATAALRAAQETGR